MTLWGITCYFNPCNYKRRYQNYIAFRKASKTQGLNLLTVELALDDQDYQLNNNDSTIMIQVRSKSTLWHKEQLLNIALDNLPKECTKVCWLDCDLIFENSNWIQETSNLLNKFVFVQPFDTVCNLDIKGNVTQKTDAYAKSLGGTYGFAWAAKRDFLNKTGGFYAYNIVGGGDNFINTLLGKWTGERYGNVQKEHIKNYIDQCPKIQRKDIHFTPGSVKHLWHGSTHNRRYKKRHEILRDNDFDPDKHIKLNDYNCLEWSSSAPNKLKVQVRKYFKERKEDSK